jgi:glucose dehydrogenase
MAGMLQVLTYLFSFYLVIKGIEVLQIGLASGRSNRSGLVLFGVLTFAICAVAAVGFSDMQDNQARSMIETGAGAAR